MQLAIANLMMGDPPSGIVGAGSVQHGTFGSSISDTGDYTFPGTINLNSAGVGAAITILGSAKSGTDQSAGNITWTANLSTGAGTPAGFVFAGGQILGTGATVQTAATIATLRMGTTTAIAEFVFGQATARLVGGSTNGLAIRNSANTRDNLLVVDSGNSATLNDGTNSMAFTTGITNGEKLAGGGIQGQTGRAIYMAAVSSGGQPAQIVYFDNTQWRSALEVASTTGFGTLDLMKSGGITRINSTTLLPLLATRAFDLGLTLFA